MRVDDHFAVTRLTWGSRYNGARKGIINQPVEVRKLGQRAVGEAFVMHFGGPGTARLAGALYGRALTCSRTASVVITVANSLSKLANAV